MLILREITAAALPLVGKDTARVVFGCILSMYLLGCIAGISIGS